MHAALCRPHPSCPSPPRHRYDTGISLIRSLIMSSTLREPLHLRQNETDGEHETPVGVALSANRCHSTRGATGLSHHFALVPSISTTTARRSGSSSCSFPRWARIRVARPFLVSHSCMERALWVLLAIGEPRSPEAMLHAHTPNGDDDATSSLEKHSAGSPVFTPAGRGSRTDPHHPPLASSSRLHLAEHSLRRAGSPRSSSIMPCSCRITSAAFLRKSSSHRMRPRDGRLLHNILDYTRLTIGSTPQVALANHAAHLP